MQLSDQLHCLIKYGGDKRTIDANLSFLAHEIGISSQALLRLLNGTTDNPHLSTLRAICCYYDISLDYFDCQTLDACIQHIEKYHPADRSPLANDILNQTKNLSPTGKRNLQTFIQWRYHAQSQS